jgi:hypothetical protein
LEHDTGEELDASLSPKASVVILDQFEQSLVRLSADKRALAAFSAAVQSRLRALSSLKLVFCIRDEYRTAFDTMLPRIASQATLFPRLPFDIDTAGNVLRRLLDNVRVAYDPQFLPTLCNSLAEGAPRTVLPALLQLVAQYFQNKNPAPERRVLGSAAETRQLAIRATR